MVGDRTDWRATASPEHLQARARLLALIREFFADREVLEVETPLLGHRTVSDVHLQSFEVRGAARSPAPLYLQTSPEYAMKRLLAGGSGPIYQLGKAFRSEEQTRQHNPEFTLLEWYRPGFTLAQLMDEVEALSRAVLGCGAIPRLTYQQLFEQHLGFNPHQVESSQLKTKAHATLSISSGKLTDTDYLQLLMSHLIEPELPPQCFVFDYPVAQAALSQIAENADGMPVAQRFELYCGGMEIANGYFELTDADEQRTRFARDNRRREELGLPPMEIDQHLLQALAQGLPECAGVALGIDRLLMLVTKASTIDEVISFPFDRA